MSDQEYNELLQILEDTNRKLSENTDEAAEIAELVIAGLEDRPLVTD